MMINHNSVSIRNQHCNTTLLIFYQNIMHTVLARDYQANVQINTRTNTKLTSAFLKQTPALPVQHYIPEVESTVMISFDVTGLYATLPWIGRTCPVSGWTKQSVGTSTTSPEASNILVPLLGTVRPFTLSSWTRSTAWSLCAGPAGRNNVHKFIYSKGT